MADDAFIKLLWLSNTSALQSNSSLIESESLADSFSHRLAGDQILMFGFDRFDRSDRFSGSSSSISEERGICRRARGKRNGLF